MPDLFEVKGAAKIRCFGKEAVLDGLKQPTGTLMGRITPDEVIFVGEPGTAAALAIPAIEPRGEIVRAPAQPTLLQQ